MCLQQINMLVFPDVLQKMTMNEMIPTELWVYFVLIIFVERILITFPFEEITCSVFFEIDLCQIVLTLYINISQFYKIVMPADKISVLENCQY
jgi:hypothetical protein